MGSLPRRPGYDRVAIRTQDLDGKTLAAIRATQPGRGSHEAERRLRLQSDAAADGTGLVVHGGDAHVSLAEVRAAIAADNVAIRARFMREVETLTAAEVEARTGSAPGEGGAPGERRKLRQTMFSVPYEGQERYPAFQFADDGCPLPVIRDILAILPDTMTPWQVAFWFVSSNSWLGGPAPRDRLDDAAAVIAAAGHESDEIGG